jgi:F0F1-type ATP synthase delta subunit
MLKRIQCNQVYLSDCNILFGALNSKKKFFDVLKHSHIDEKDKDEIAMKVYQKIAKDPAVPHFLSIFNHTLILVDQTMTP